MRLLGSQGHGPTRRGSPTVQGRYRYLQHACKEARQVTPAVGSWVPGDQMSTSTLQRSSAAAQQAILCENALLAPPPLFLPPSSARPSYLVLHAHTHSHRQISGS